MKPYVWIRSLLRKWREPRAESWWMLTFKGRETNRNQERRPSRSGQNREEENHREESRKRLESSKVSKPQRPLQTRLRVFWRHYLNFDDYQTPWSSLLKTYRIKNAGMSLWLCISVKPPGWFWYVVGFENHKFRRLA